MTVLASLVALARGPRGRWARGLLVLAGDRGDRAATDAVWDLWFEQPDPRLWAALTRWGRPRTGGGLSLVALGAKADPADVAAAAGRGGHPVAATARAAILAGAPELVDAVCAAVLSTQDKELTAFCVEHHLAPADPGQAAMFFLLTGQQEQYRLADPDHSLLALAYQGASEDLRSRVRSRAAGDPDAVRVLADTVRGGKLARLSRREAAYLVDGFAERRDWAGLWQLAKGLPVVDAAAAARRVTGWRPAGHDGDLFDVLAAADPAALTEARHAATRPVRLPAGNVFRASISPDGRRVAVGTPRAVDVFACADGTHLEHVPTTLHPRVLALDDDVLVVSDTDPRQPTGPPGTWRFHWASVLARTADGFAALVYDQKKNRHRLHLLSGSGRDFDRYGHRVLDVRAELAIPAKFPHETCTVAVDAGTGRLAVSASKDLYLAEITADGLRLLATVPGSGGMLRHLAFSGPDRLLRLTWGGELQVWRLDGDAPRVVAERGSAAEVADVPGAGVVAMIPRPGSRMPRRVHYLDATTLADVPTPGQYFDRGEPGHVFAAPDGDRLGVGYAEFTEVVDAALVALADRPLATTTPADLALASARLDRGNLFLTLLHECLAHRFGGDVALGDAGPGTGRADDIALGDAG